MQSNEPESRSTGARTHEVGSSRANVNGLNGRAAMGDEKDKPLGTAEAITAFLERENERFEDRARRIGRAICDEIRQTLALIQLELDRLEPEGSPNAAKRISRASELLHRVDSQLGSVSQELWPTQVLEHLGLPPALEFLTKQFSESSGIPIRLNVSLEDQVPPEVAAVLLKAIEEAFSNLVRHSRATLGEVHLLRKDGKITCSIRDNGVGFEANEIISSPGHNGVGIIGIRHMVERAGGTFVVYSARSGDLPSAEARIRCAGITLLRRTC